MHMCAEPRLRFSLVVLFNIYICILAHLGSTNLSCARHAIVQLIYNFNFR